MFLAIWRGTARNCFLVAPQVVSSLRLAKVTCDWRCVASFEADKFSTTPARLKKIRDRPSTEVSRRFPRAHLPKRALVGEAV
jgi:hypothetical protein